MYRIVGEKQSQLEAKKSRFLGFCFYVESVEQVKEILASFEGKYKGAVHTVYAYRLREGGVLREKFDNDREPVGSAGPPLLLLLKNKNLMNCLLVVVRYFGGTLLGVGGLVRAYTGAGQMTLEENLCLLEQKKEN